MYGVRLWLQESGAGFQHSEVVIIRPESVFQLRGIQREGKGGSLLFMFEVDAGSDGFAE